MTQYNLSNTGLYVPSRTVFNEMSPKSMYTHLKALYDNNGLYESVSKAAYINSTWIEALKPLRTVVNRSVEFFVSKVLPGNSVEVVTDSEAIKEAIDQVLSWSNFSNKKQTYVRDLTLYGDLFLKVVNDEEKVYFEEIAPVNVTDFTTDKRGYLTSIRIDVSIKDDKGRDVTYTEYWTKEYLAIWIHNFDENVPIDQLGDTKEFHELSEFGIDFIPIVHIKFRDTGDMRGKSCVAHAIDKIHEANREATRLAQILFRYNKPLWTVSANAVDSNGIALPAPNISNKTTSNISQTGEVIKNDNSIIYLPGLTTINSLIPNINYDAALAILNAMMDELEQDLPELRYYSIQDSNLSGKAIKLLLGAAVDRAEEARNNLIQGLERVDEIALTIGKNFNIFPSNIGSFENGDFDHDLTFDEAFGQSIDEKALAIKTLVDAGFSLSTAMRMVGFTEEEILQAQEEKNQDSLRNTNLLATSLTQFNAA